MVSILASAKWSFAEGTVNAPMQYCTADGFRGSSGSEAINSELASIQSKPSFCAAPGNVSYPVTWSLGASSTSQSNGGVYLDRCKAGTVPGTVTSAPLIDTCTGTGISDSQVSLQAFPIGPSCPVGSTPNASGTCSCNSGNAPSNDPNDANTCYPVSVTVSPSPKSACVAYGDPIYPLNGSAAEEIDLELGLGRLPSILYYNTAMAVATASPIHRYLGEGSDAATNPGVLGGYWFLELDKRIVTSLDPNNISVYTGKGSYIVFTLNSPGVYTSVVDSGKVVKTASGYFYYDFDKNQVESYDLGGTLQSITSSDSRSETLTYSTTQTSLSVAPGPGYVISISDAFGHSLNITYQVLSGNIIRPFQIFGPTETVQFSYNTSGLLSNVQWINLGVGKGFSYDSTNVWAMTSITDEAGVAWLNYTYDSQGRAIATSFGNGAGAYSFDYADTTGAPDAPYPGIVDVLNKNIGNGVIERSFQWHPTAAAHIKLPSGATTTVVPVLAKNYPAAAAISQPAGSGCAASSKSAVYDTSGNPISRDDFNGNRSCFAYDSARSLATMVLEGRSSANACSFVPSTTDTQHPERLTTTAWHPDWALKVREASPKQIITWVYNGQPDPIAGTTASCVAPATSLPDGKPLAVLCSRYEQATTDASGVQGFAAPATGAMRAWNYTYNQYGQVLTETKPKQSATDALSHTTTYTYYPSTSFSGSVGHTLGDLQTATNSLGQAVSYMTYDSAGRLLSSKDPNGTVTTQTYFPRGWLQTVTVTPASGTALTTTYAYWPTGLLKTVTLPDSSTLNYTYDVAHRLTDVVDGAGNKLHYELDNVGNRTSEQVTDASGKLVSSVARVFDALNRVQSTTGAMH